MRAEAGKIRGHDLLLSLPSRLEERPNRLSIIRQGEDLVPSRLFSIPASSFTQGFLKPPSEGDSRRSVGLPGAHMYFPNYAGQ